MRKTIFIASLFLAFGFLCLAATETRAQTCLKPFAIPDKFQNPAEDVGAEIILRTADPGVTSPSLFFPVALPGSVGGNDYRANIEGCNTSPLGPGDIVFAEPGNMVGPTRQGIEGLIESDPNATWDPLTNRIIGSEHPQSPRVGAVLLHAEQLEGNQKGRNVALKVSRILGVFFEPADETGMVKGRIAPVCGDGDCNEEWEEGPENCPGDCEADCNTPEDTSDACFDGKDNDCDAQVDCDDVDCRFVCAAAVGLTVTPTQLSSAVGENALYVISVTNGGPNVTTATVTGPVHLGSTVIFAGPPLNGPPENNFTCQVTANQISCSGDVAASSTSDIVIIKEYQAPGEFTDFISLSATSDSTPNDNSAQVITTVVPGADVNVIVQTATGGTEFQVGQDVAYVIHVLNAGPAATTVTLTDSVFLIGSTVLSAQIAGGDFCAVDAGTQIITCSLDMPPATAADIIVVKEYAFPEVYEEIIEAVSSTKDPNLGDNSFTLSLTISP